MKFTTLSLFLGLILLTVSSCSKEKPLIPLMTCSISQTLTECSATPTLEKGELKTLSGEKFTLDARYQACFHQENVHIQGKYKGTSFNKSLTVELLATKIKGLKSSEFPTTIAVVTLEKSTLKGVINDIWANIRSSIQSDEKHVAEITCKKI
jgi:hypothetical protein